MTRRLALALVTAAALAATALPTAPAEARARSCGVVVNKYDRPIAVRVERGSVRCSTALYVGRNADLYAGGRGPRGWTCWHQGAAGVERGNLGGCSKGRAVIGLYVPRRR